MRLVKEVPHSHYLIQVHEYNGKYLLKITLDNFEQTFKIPVSEVADLEQFTSRLSHDFWASCLKRFLTMREDYVQLINSQIP